MPELSDDMYCSQQIMVPPMFPYLLRQYAKAAIRSQPTDLLRWSTAYFRCLSLNLPPPVKPRLEYPIPKDYDGITPGWLRALLHQFGETAHVDYKTLWDRWIGSCLQHYTLIKILCLGGFDNPYAVPFRRFIALCAGFISENLTQTMILLCEVLTEEPEGGSAMITLELFLDLYTYLANIDASKDQIIINRYFRDSLLELLEKKKKKAPPPAVVADLVVQREVTPEASTVEEEEKVIEEMKDEVSCPDITEIASVSSKESSTAVDRVSVTVPPVDDFSVATREERVSPPAEHPVAVELSTEDLSVEDITQEEGYPSKSNEFIPVVDDDDDNQEEEDKDKDSDKDNYKVEDEEEEKSPSKVIVVDEEPAAIDEDITKYLTEMEKGSVEEEEARAEIEEVLKVESLGKSESLEEVEEEVEEEEEKVELEEIFVEAIPGIGGIVPPELLAAVVEYMKKCAATQHGMIMPRNIRHYSCPPLEVLD